MHSRGKEPAAKEILTLTTFSAVSARSDAEVRDQFLILPMQCSSSAACMGAFASRQTRLPVELRIEPVTSWMAVGGHDFLSATHSIRTVLRRFIYLVWACSKTSLLSPWIYQIMCVFHSVYARSIFLDLQRRRTASWSFASRKKGGPTCHRLLDTPPQQFQDIEVASSHSWCHPPAVLGYSASLGFPSSAMVARYFCEGRPWTYVQSLLPLSRTPIIPP